MSKIVIDASGSVLGRLASYVAKQSLLGKEVAVVNCDQIHIVGVKESILEKRRHDVRGRHGHSMKGPKVPRKDTGRVLKRTIRGMLSHKQGRGAEALDRIRCYPNVPREYVETKKETITKKIKTSSLTLKEISTKI